MSACDAKPKTTKSSARTPKSLTSSNTAPACPRMKTSKDIEQAIDQGSVTLKRVLSGQTCPPISYVDFKRHMQKNGNGNYILFYEGMLDYVSVYRQWMQGKAEAEHQVRVAERLKKERENKEEREREKAMSAAANAMGGEGLQSTTNLATSSGMGNNGGSHSTNLGASTTTSDWTLFVDGRTALMETETSSVRSASEPPTPTTLSRPQVLPLSTETQKALAEDLDLRARKLYENFIRAESPSAIDLPTPFRTLLRQTILVPPGSCPPHAPSLFLPSFQHTLGYIADTYFKSFRHRVLRSNLGASGVAKRYIITTSFTIITVMGMLINVFLQHSPFLRFALILPLFGISSGVWQLQQKFCLFKGLAGVREDMDMDMFMWSASNLPVIDPYVLNSQKTQARVMFIGSLLIALVTSALLVILVPWQISPTYKFSWSA
ncbi:hypothetical protein DFS34DRAFT_622395 [Phlyctochytrium arcticum]|nr:hypothetical protein DFS34DRAFT_622395 [Phlyctochytrium arcticum]